MSKFKPQKKIIFFIPSLKDDGIKKTLETYINFFSKKFKIIVITNTLTKPLKNKDIVFDNSNNFLLNFRVVNLFYCVFKVLKFYDKNTIIFSLDDHFILLFLKKLNFQFKLMIRTSNPIYDPKNSLKFEDSPGIISKNELNYFKYANCVITYSEYNKILLRNFFKVKNVEVINNFFPKNYVKRSKKNILNIYFVGRFVDSKDPVFFLSNTLKLLNKKKIKIYMIGKGYLKKKLKLISKDFSKNIIILPYISNPIIKFKNKIDIFCLTSKFDGTPNVLGEAVSCNIPCLAPKNVGLSNILLLNGKGGYLYKSNDASDFKKKLHKIIKNYNQALSKSKIAFKKIDRFSKKNTLEKLSRLITKLYV